ncbi:MAG: hypothetical protein H0V44_11810 [Planctomycetes bacterium]|nr:hypothetical protein [Planctomycetota bacterium]
MNLDRCTIVVRERTIPELYDLGLALTRRHAGAVALLTTLASAPWVALDWWLLSGLGWAAVYPAFLLLAMQAPLATAPLTAYLGEAMFSGDPTMRGALRAALTRWRALLLVALLRGVAAVIPFLLLYFPAHLVEVLLLERQPFGAAWKRSMTMIANWRSEHGAHAVMGTLTCFIGAGVAIWSGLVLVQLLVWGSTSTEIVGEWLDPGSSVLPLILVWPLCAYLAVVRFLAYIDLRTRNEGWDVELDLRRAGSRIAGEAA